MVIGTSEDRILWSNYYFSKVSRILSSQPNYSLIFAHDSNRCCRGFQATDNWSVRRFSKRALRLLCLPSEPQLEAVGQQVANTYLPPDPAKRVPWHRRHVRLHAHDVHRTISHNRCRRQMRLVHRVDLSQPPAFRHAIARLYRGRPQP
jgi:hypothetical protein